MGEAFNFGSPHCNITATVYFVNVLFHREVKWCARSEDALLCHVHTQHWTAVHVECVMDAILVDEIVSTEKDFHILQIAVSSAPVWYSMHILTHFTILKTIRVTGYLENKQARRIALL